MSGAFEEGGDEGVDVSNRITLLPRYQLKFKTKKGRASAQPFVTSTGIEWHRPPGHIQSLENSYRAATILFVELHNSYFLIHRGAAHLF
jgi:hypothetical protein